MIITAEINSSYHNSNDNSYYHYSRCYTNHDYHRSKTCEWIPNICSSRINGRSCHFRSPDDATYCASRYYSNKQRDMNMLRSRYWQAVDLDQGKSPLAGKELKVNHVIKCGSLVVIWCSLYGLKLFCAEKLSESLTGIEPVTFWLLARSSNYWTTRIQMVSEGYIYALVRIDGI